MLAQPQYVPRIAKLVPMFDILSENVTLTSCFSRMTKGELKNTSTIAKSLETRSKHVTLEASGIILLEFWMKL